MHRAGVRPPISPSWPSELSIGLRQDVCAWLELWGVSELEPHITICFSRRLRSSLGRAHFSRSLVTLQTTLLDPTATELLREVLCHELAHLAAYRLHGMTIRPHGPQWKALLVAAGYRPSVTFAAEALPACFSRHPRGALRREQASRSRRKHRMTRARALFHHIAHALFMDCRVLFAPHHS